MSNKASGTKKLVTGWVVQVTAERAKGPVVIDLYHVAIADRARAIAAVRQYYRHVPTPIIEAIRTMPNTTRLQDGDILWQ